MLSDRFKLKEQDKKHIFQTNVFKILDFISKHFFKCNDQQFPIWYVRSLEVATTS